MQTFCIFGLGSVNVGSESVTLKQDIKYSFRGLEVL